MSPTHLRSLTFSLAPTPAMVGAARRRIVDALTCWGVAPSNAAMGAMCLISAELIGNAVRHAGTVTQRILVELRVDTRGQVVLGVRDQDERLPYVRHAGLLEDSGRGLPLVSALLTEYQGRLWITRGSRPGKTVWAAFRLPEKYAPTEYSEPAYAA
ncbi:ATP-binding protein (plasmid) [Streptomycetaceae bacterium NBC_01309]